MTTTTAATIGEGRGGSGGHMAARQHMEHMAAWQRAHGNTFETYKQSIMKSIRWLLTKCHNHPKSVMMVYRLPQSIGEVAGDWIGLDS